MYYMHTDVRMGYQCARGTQIVKKCAQTSTHIRMNTYSHDVNDQAPKMSKEMAGKEEEKQK